MDPQTEFIVFLSVSAVSGLVALFVAILGWSLRINWMNARTDYREGIARAESSNTALARRVDSQETKHDALKERYISGHSEVVARIQSLESLVQSALRDLQNDVKSLLAQVPVMTSRLDHMERTINNGYTKRSD